MTMPDTDGILRFVTLALRLKTLRRQGWVDRGVEDAESVADHSWSVALLAWLLAAERPDLDRDRVLLLGIAHDLPEALAGDSTPFDVHRDEAGVIPGEHFVRTPEYSDEQNAAKRQIEEAALEEMLARLDDGLAEDLRAAWREYDDAETAEARFVKQVDKLETVIQALAYREADPNIVIESFLQGGKRDITDVELGMYLKAILPDS